jgi:putative FmdB family regulatory protein
MPLYEYQCESCGHRFEKIRKFSDPPLEKCPVCGGPVRKLLSSPAIKFKGTGWYITDYAKKSSTEGQAGSKGTGENAQGGDKTESESKTNSDSKADAGGKGDSGNKSDSSGKGDAGGQGDSGGKGNSRKTKAGESTGSTAAPAGTKPK